MDRPGFRTDSLHRPYTKRRFRHGFRFPNFWSRHGREWNGIPMSFPPTRSTQTTTNLITGKRFWEYLFLFLLFSISFAVRVFHLSEFDFLDLGLVRSPETQLSHHYFGYFDSDLFWYFGKETLRGNPVFPFHPPLTQFLLAGLIHVLGDSYFHAKLFFLGTASFSYVLLFLLTRRLTNETTAVVASLLCCFSFGLMALNETIASENPFSVLLIGLIFLACYFPSIPNKLFLLLFGVLSGLAVLSRSEMILFLPILVFWMAWNFRPRFRPAFIPVVFLVTFLTLFPWGYRNKAIFDIWCFTSLNGPYNFAAANSPLATGGDDRRVYGLSKRPDAIWIDLNDPLERNYFLHGYRIGLSFIGPDPSRFFGLVAHKIRLSLDALSLGFFEKDFPGGLAGTRKTLDFFTPDNKIAWYPALFLLGIGLFSILWEDRPRRAILPAVLGFKLLVIAAFFGHVRGILSILPFCFAIQGHGLARGFRLLPVRVDPIRAGVLALLVGGTICFFQWEYPEVMVTSRHILNPSQIEFDANRFDRALPLMEEEVAELGQMKNVIKDNLEISEAHLRISKMAYARGDIPGAIRNLEMALEFDPISESAHRDLGYLYFHSTGEYRKAAEQLEIHLKLYPNDPEANGIRFILNQARLKGNGGVSEGKREKGD